MKSIIFFMLIGFCSFVSGNTEYSSTKILDNGSKETNTVVYDSDGNQVSHTKVLDRSDGTKHVENLDENGFAISDEAGTSLEGIEKTYSEDLSAPIMNIFGSTEWKLLLSEFEINLNIHFCGNIMPGLEAHMIDIVGYLEETNKPLYFPFADLTIEANPIKSNTPYSSLHEMVRPQTVNAHFIYIPILGMIFKKEVPVFCFHSGPITIPYLSEFDPSYKQDTLGMQMIPQMIAMMSPDSILAGMLDCVATEVCGALYGNNDLESVSSDPDDAMVDAFERSESTLSQYANSGRTLCNTIRDSLYFINGCNGFNPVGGYKPGKRPILDAHLGWAGLSNMLYTMSAITSVPVLQKTAKLSLEYGTHPDVSMIPNTMCAPRDFAMAAPSWNVLQLSGYPTTQKAKEEGSSMNTDNAVNVPGAAGSVHIIWKRRDYYAFAYQCN